MNRFLRETYKSREQQCDQVAQQKPQEDGFSGRVFHLHFWVRSTSQERTKTVVLAIYLCLDHKTDIKNHTNNSWNVPMKALYVFFFWDVTFKERESAFATSFVWDELNKNLILCPGKPGRFPCWDVFWIFFCFFPQNCDTLGVFPEFFPVGSMGAAILYLPTFYIPIKNITYTLYLKIYGHRFFWESVTGFLSGRSRQDVYLHLPTWTP